MIKKIMITDEASEKALMASIRRTRFEDSNVTESVAEIISKVVKEGDKAVFEFAKKFDGADIDKTNLKVSRKEIEEAYFSVDKTMIDLIRKAKANIEDFHKKQLESSWFSSDKEGVILGQIKRPLETAGVYVPGGTAVYPSSVLMNVIPAKVAGVKKIIMATPPRKNGIDPMVIVAAEEAGVDAIYKMGGAYAIAAMAYGTGSIPKVDKITGPGNIYVATAKKLVFGECDIDSIAGPSEILIIADKTATPAYVAADMLSQAEHDKMASSILLTDSEKIADDVVEQLELQLKKLSRSETARQSLEERGVVAVVKNIESAVSIAGKVAPEHLELCVDDAFSKLNGIENAGAIFVGQYSPEPVGDYFAGPNHVLPTGGTARFFSPLGVDDFVKKTSVISYSKEALSEIKDDVAAFAEAEGLTAHAEAVRKRFDKD